MDREELPADADIVVTTPDMRRMVLILGGGSYGKSVAAQLAMEALAKHGKAVTRTTGDGEVTFISHDEFTDIPRELFDREIALDDEVRAVTRARMEAPAYEIIEKPRYHPVSPKQSRHGERYPRNSGGKKGKRRGR